MSVHAMSRLVADGAGHNTINVRTVKLFFQKSPGKPKGDNRGIPDLQFRVLFDDLIVRELQTDKAGMIEVPLSDGKARLDLLDAGEAVSTYELAVDDAAMASVDSVLGQQQRLRHLGYQLGHAGSTGDGVGTPGPPLDITPEPDRPRDDEEDEDDRELDRIEEQERQDNPAIEEENFVDLNFFTERSILDFQGDEGIFIDGRVGPVTQKELAREAGE
jgi:hypothetical protein